MNSSVFKQAIVENDVEHFALMVQENPGILEQTRDESSDTVLHLATRHGHIGLAAEILRLCPSMVAAENMKGETPLHEACRQGHDEILMMLMETDPWVASKLNCQSQSALYLACRYGHLKAACIFLNQPWLHELDDDATSLRVAAAEGHIAIVTKILETCPNSAQKLDKNGCSPLHHACSRGHPEITAMLLRYDLTQAFQFDRTGYAPVHLAAINGSSKVLKELLSAAPTCFELLSRIGETVFHLMVKFDRIEAFLYLHQVLKNGTLFRQPDKNGDTCLHLAISRGCYNIAEHIIKEAGEQISCQNFVGHTAMDLIEHTDSTSSRHLREMLEEAGAKRNRAENVSVPITEPLTLEELSKENKYNSFNLRTPEFRTPASTESPSNDELSDQATKFLSASETEVDNQRPRIPRFGEWSDQQISSRRKRSSKSRMNQYKLRSEKSRKNLIKLYQTQHKRDEIYREELHNARETMALVAVLITTITYTGGINPPGGVYQDGPLRGTAVAAERKSFKVYSICNNVALFASLSIVIVFVSIIPFKRKPLVTMLRLAHKVMWVAVGSMATAYFAASLVLLPPSHGQRMDWTVVSLLSISAGTLGSIFVALGGLVLRHHWKKWGYGKKVNSTQHREAAEHSDLEADNNSFPGFGRHSSINSDMDISILYGYHAY